MCRSGSTRRLDSTSTVSLESCLVCFWNFIDGPECVVLTSTMCVQRSHARWRSARDRDSAGGPASSASASAGRANLQTGQSRLSGHEEGHPAQGAVDEAGGGELIGFAGLRADFSHFVILGLVEFMLGSCVWKLGCSNDDFCSLHKSRWLVARYCEFIERWIREFKENFWVSIEKCYHYLLDGVYNCVNTEIYRNLNILIL